ncbi:MAG: CapA family protein [Deltaproteobacteria bacterium]|nr:CapA family protein [Deltaproteobacteria bacterium]
MSSLLLIVVLAWACAARQEGEGGKRPAGTPARKRASVPAAALPAALQPTPPPAPAEARTAGPRELARVRLAAVGDVLPHGEVLKSAAQADRKGPDGKSQNHGGFDALFCALRPELADRDLVFANLESPIAPASGRKCVPYFFNAPPDLLHALRALGVRVLSFANNHVYDQKRRGFEETLVQLERSGLVFAGAGRTCAEARRAKIIEKNGISLAFLAASTLFNQQLNRREKDPCAFAFDERQALAEAAAARKAGADLVVLSLHWNTEYVTAPSQADIDQAHRLIEGGVDVILGHHPHVLRPVEVYQASDGRVGFVAYSLGNFISNQSRYYVHGLQPARIGNTRDGVILRFSAIRKDYGHGIVKVELADLSVQPLWTRNNALARRRDKKLPVIIRVVANDREIEKLREQIQALLLPSTPGPDTGIAGSSPDAGTPQAGAASSRDAGQPQADTGRSGNAGLPQASAGRSGNAGPPQASAGGAGNAGPPQASAGRSGDAGLPQASAGGAGNAGLPQASAGGAGDAGPPQASAGRSGNAGPPQASAGGAGNAGLPQASAGRFGDAGPPQASAGGAGNAGPPQASAGRSGNAGPPQASAVRSGNAGLPQAGAGGYRDAGPSAADAGASTGGPGSPDAGIRADDGDRRSAVSDAGEAPELLSPERREALARLLKELELLEARRAIAAGILGEDWLWEVSP